MIPYLRFETLKIHNLLGGGGHILIRPTYGRSPPPPPPPPPPPHHKDNMCGFSDVFKLFVVNLVKHKQHLTKLRKKAGLFTATASSNL